jgi:hypothetical protein
MDMSPRSSGRFVVSLGVLALLAVLVWFTIDPGKMQQVTWLLLGFFAFRIVIANFRSHSSSGEPVAEIDYATADAVDERDVLESRRESLKL